MWQQLKRKTLKEKHFSGAPVNSFFFVFTVMFVSSFFFLQCCFFCRKKKHGVYRPNEKEKKERKGEDKRLWTETNWLCRTTSLIDLTPPHSSFSFGSFGLDGSVSSLHIAANWDGPFFAFLTDLCTSFSFLISFVFTFKALQSSLQAADVASRVSGGLVANVSGVH